MASLTNGHEFEQALGVGDGQGCLVCCSPWGHKERPPLSLYSLITRPQRVKEDVFPGCMKFHVNISVFV